MKLGTLMENTTACDNLHCEHGLSLYLETGDHKILFDAGQSSAFAENAEKLGVDLRKVDFAVFEIFLIHYSTLFAFPIFNQLFFHVYHLIDSIHDNVVIVKA